MIPPLNAGGTIMTKQKKFGCIATIILAIVGAFLFHPLASLPIIFVGFKLVFD